MNLVGNTLLLGPGAGHCSLGRTISAGKLTVMGSALIMEISKHWQMIGLTDSRITPGLNGTQVINSDYHDQDHYRCTDSTFLMSLGRTHQSKGEKHREEHSVAGRLLKSQI